MEIIEDINVLHHTCYYYNEYILLILYTNIYKCVCGLYIYESHLNFYLQYLFCVSSFVQFYVSSFILNHRGHPHCIHFLSIKSLLLFALSEFPVYCAAVSPSFLTYLFLFGISSPSYCLNSVTVPLFSCRIQEQRGSF